MQKIYKNSYQRPDPAGNDASSQYNVEATLYDHNFMFPVQMLKSGRVELRPFVPSLHAHELWRKFSSYTVVNVLQFQSLVSNSWEDMMRDFEFTRQSTNAQRYAVYTVPPNRDPATTPSGDYVLAGMVGNNKASAKRTSINIGLVILPEFQRTHVQTHTTGLLLHRALDLPSQGGYGLRKVGWSCLLIPNTPSMVAAKRMGFKQEVAVHQSYVSTKGRAGTGRGRPGVANEDRDAADNWVGVILWEDWESSVRDHVDNLMAR